MGASHFELGSSCTVRKPWDHRAAQRDGWDGCGDTSTAMTEQEARVVEDAVVPPDASDGSEMPNVEQQSQARPHLGGRLLRLISAA